MIGDSSVRSVAGCSAQVGATSTNQGAANAETATCAGASTRDALDISAEGLLADMFGIESKDGTVQLVGLDTALAHKTAALHAETTRLFREAGITMGDGVKLRTDAMGNVRVSGEHPEKEEIEAVFRDNPDTANRFRQVSAMSSLMRAAQESVAFQEAYARDPEAAIQRYAYLFNDGPRGYDFLLKMTEAGAEPMFSDGYELPLDSATVEGEE